MKISVIMVCFNSEKSIGTAIQSFLDQQYESRELLVIDGASRDATCAIARSFNSPLISVMSERDSGIYDAMNKGLRRFGGDAFGFLNSDDRFHDPQSLKKVAAALEQADIVTGDLEFVRSHDGGPPVRHWRAEAFHPGAFKTGWSLPHPTTYARRAVYERVGEFDPSYRSAGDYDWLIRALEIEGFRHARIPSTLVDMRVGGESTAGFRALVQNSREQLRARRNRLRSGFVDLALVMNAIRKLRQTRWLGASH